MERASVCGRRCGGRRGAPRTKRRRVRGMGGRRRVRRRGIRAGWLRLCQLVVLRGGVKV